MDKTFPLIECNIRQIYLESQEMKTYKIPVYQRNYAWEEDEISALIKDVYDSFNNDPSTPYYIGTLVTYKRGDSEYEVIDGQQRLTTIYIILKAMGVKDFRNKLTYSARKVSASTIQKLDDYPDLGEEVDRSIKYGYKFAEKALSDIDSNKRESFKQYFIENVHIIHYRVPKDVDLNHYFEVMNSRGEQLEKHEIVKSTLSQFLNSKTDLATFNRVWEACSEMNIYIQQAFPNTEIFGKQSDRFKIKCFEKIPPQDVSAGKMTILHLMNEPMRHVEEKHATEQSDKFQPIIDFPNFLLIALKVTLMEYEFFEPTDFALDDKDLLNEFNKALESVDDQAEFARQFCFNLLKAKYLLDNYIVHHSLDDKEFTGDNPWKLQYYCHNNGRKYPVNLAGQSAIQDELVHLLSMFEVSFTPKQRKNYLFYCMMYLFDNFEPSAEDYLEFLQNLADKYFYDVYLNQECLNERNQPGPNAFDNALFANGDMDVDDFGNEEIDFREAFENIYKQGRSDIPLYVFNYTDYLLWKKYADELRGKDTKKGSKARADFFRELGCSVFNLDVFDNFYFSRTRKSLEHFYPQAKTGDGKPLTSDNINCFGNFAMIGAEANSSGSNWDPTEKLHRYADEKINRVSVASLKFKIMMQICRDNQKAMMNGDLVRDAGMEWNADDMQVHQQKMLDIIIADLEYPNN